MIFTLLRSSARLGSLYLFLLSTFNLAQSQTLPAECGALRAQGQFGPYDYRPDKYIPEGTYKSHKVLLGIVDNAHFTTEVELLIRGKTGAIPGTDIAYTLRAFPNHHRAIISMVALGEKSAQPKPPGSTYTVECWFQRAMTFAPDDHIVRLIFANYLAKHARKSEAEQQLDNVASKTENNPFTYRNLGLIYFEMGMYDKSLIYAHKASELGLDIATLQEQLKRVGKWSEPALLNPDKPASSP